MRQRFRLLDSLLNGVLICSAFECGRSEWRSRSAFARRERPAIR